MVSKVTDIVTDIVKVLQKKTHEVLTCSTEMSAIIK